MTEPRTRAYNDRDWKNKRHLVLERDNYICHLCNNRIGPIDPNPRDYTQPNAGVADHLKPVAHGGSNELHNLKAAHVICNQRRGDAPPPKHYKTAPRR